MSLRLCGICIWLIAASPISCAMEASADASLGRISFPNSGSAAAQPAFIRGVLLLHSFEYDDAIQAFRQAQKADPNFALAYWGEALSYNQPLWYHEDSDKAHAVLTRLAPSREQRRAKAPTAREKRYLEAVEELFGPGDKTSRDRIYADRMGALSRDFPDDDEAAAFYALALLATIPSGQRNPDVSLKAGAIATAILKKNPQHPGAAHYALHAFDDGEHAAMGLDAARIYARIAPASSHARHMPSHVFLPLGMWDEAVASDESAFAASVDRVKRLGLSMAQADFHSLSWLHYEYLQQGRFAKAREVEQIVVNALAAPRTGGPVHIVPVVQAFRPAVGGGPEGPHYAGGREGPHYAGGREGPRYAGGPEGPHAAGAGHQHADSEIGRGFGAVSLKSELGSMRARRIVESGSWEEMKGQGSFENIDELYALGAASVRLDDAARASAALEHLAKASQSVPDADAREIAAIMQLELDGLMRLARGDTQQALSLLARAAALEAKRPRPIARPYPIKPAGELYGEALLAAGDAAKALSEFQKALARTPRRAQSLIGAVRAARRAGRRTEAVNAAKEFTAMWRLADAGRPEMADARAIAR